MTHHQPPFDEAVSLERARACFEAYGADTARWPQEARSLATALKTDERFAAMRESAARLDAALALPPAPGAGEPLMRSVLADFDARRSGDALLARFGLGSGRGFMRLLPAGAVAGLSALGFMIGASTVGVAGANAYETLYYAQATPTVAIEEEDAFWAAE